MFLQNTCPNNGGFRAFEHFSWVDNVDRILKRDLYYTSGTYAYIYLCIL